MKLVHTPGTCMIQSDALSRRADYIHGEDTDNENRILLPDDIFIKLINVDQDDHNNSLPDNLFISLIDLELADDLKKAIQEDELFAKALEALKTTGTPPIKSNLSDWKFEDDLLFFKDRCYVAPNVTLRKNIVQRYHDEKPSGHPGCLKTQELISRDYWWPGMGVFIKNYVDGCALCQQMKVNTHPTRPGLMPIPTDKGARPFSRVTCDFITDLPENDGKDSLMVVVDHGLTKGVIPIVCTKNVDALNTANFYIEHVYKRFGLPDIFLSDRGPQFAAQAF